MKRNFWKIVSGVAVSAAGIGLMMHWGPLGFVVGSMMAAGWFENRGAVMRRQSTNHLFMSVISQLVFHSKIALHLPGRG